MRLFLILPCLTLSACGETGVAQLDQLQSQNPGALATPVVETQIAPANPNAVLAPDVSFATLLNNVRLANQQGAVSYDARLDQAAQSYAEELVAQRRFDHQGLDGSTPGTRATAAGYQWSYIAENIALGRQTETEVLTAWQNSPGHRANNLDSRAEDFGLGVAGSGGEKRWVLMLGRGVD